MGPAVQEALLLETLVYSSQKAMTSHKSSSYEELAHEHGIWNRIRLPLVFSYFFGVFFKVHHLYVEDPGKWSRV